MTAKIHKLRHSTGTRPTRKLAKNGAALWEAVNAEYGIEDSAGVEMLLQACTALDRCENLREAIDRDGEVIRTKAGIREHPAIKTELMIRAFVVRTLARLGLDAEPVKAIGRPPAKGFEGFDNED